jgi:hypothetical protein
MAKQNFREMKLSNSVRHQAICNDCSFSGALRNTVPEASADALSHVSKPGKENHIVTISTITTRTRAFRGA